MFELLERKSWLENKLPEVVRYGLERKKGYESFYPNGITEEIELEQHIITGQQPGFLGGPLYTTYKRWTAEFLSKTNQHFFWIESGDTDWNEIATVYWKTKEIQWTDTQPNVPTTYRYFPDEVFQDLIQLESSPFHQQRLETTKDAFNGTVVQSFLEFQKRLGIAQYTEWVEGPPRLPQPYSEQYQRLLLEWMKDLRYGILAIRKGIQRVYDKFGNVQAELLKHRTGWFYLQDHGSQRVPIEWDENDFYINHKRLNSRDMYDLVKHNIGFFIPGVLWRPMVQQALFSPQVVVLGTSEAAYWAELNDLMLWAQLKYPKIVIRLGATILTKKYQSLTWKEILSNTPPILEKSKHIEEVEKLFQQLIQQFDHIEENLPIHIQHAIQKSKEKIHYQFKKTIDILERYFDEIQGSKRKLWNQFQSEIGKNSIPQERKMTLLEAYVWWGKEGIQSIYELLKNTKQGGHYLFREL